MNNDVCIVCRPRCRVPKAKFLESAKFIKIPNTRSLPPAAGTVTRAGGRADGRGKRKRAVREKREEKGKSKGTDEGGRAIPKGRWGEGLKNIAVVELNENPPGGIDLTNRLQRARSTLIGEKSRNFSSLSPTLFARPCIPSSHPSWGNHSRLFSV